MTKESHPRPEKISCFSMAVRDGPSRRCWRLSMWNCVTPDALWKWEPGMVSGLEHCQKPMIHVRCKKCKRTNVENGLTLSLPMMTCPICHWIHTFTIPTRNHNTTILVTSANWKQRRICWKYWNPGCVLAKSCWWSTSLQVIWQKKWYKPMQMQLQIMTRWFWGQRSWRSQRQWCSVWLLWKWRLGFAQGHGGSTTTRRHWIWKAVHPPTERRGEAHNRLKA